MQDFDSEMTTELATAIGLSGISDKEVRWTAHRLIELISTHGKSKEEALAVVKFEAVYKPWESPAKASGAFTRPDVKPHGTSRAEVRSLRKARFCTRQSPF